jgi:hypothetical protein
MLLFFMHERPVLEELTLGGDEHGITLITELPK